MPDGWMPEKILGRGAGDARGAGSGASSTVIPPECTGRAIGVRYHPGDVDGPVTPPMSLQPLRVGVLGAGTLGREVVRAFVERSPRLAPADGAPLVLGGVAVRDVGRAVVAGVPEALLTDAPAHLVADPSIDVLVEVIGGEEPARTLVLAALAHGR